MEDFASTALTEYSVVVVNGYLQAINIKQVIVFVQLGSILVLSLQVFFTGLYLWLLD